MVPFVVAPGLRLNEETMETFSGLHLTVGPMTAGYNRFVFDGLATVDQAHSVFATLKGGVLAAGLYASCGVRIADGLTLLEESAPMPSEPDRALVYRQGRDLSRLILSIGETSFQASRVLPRFLDGLRTGITAESVSRAMQDQRVQLASLLYTDSHFERSMQARFIGLIGVLEVLKDQQRGSSPEVLQLIDQWTDQLKQSGAHDAQSVVQRLANLKKVSIGDGIRSLTRRHLGDEAARLAGKLYTLRSQLIHAGRVPADLPQVLGETKELVRQLLARILTAGAR